MALTTIVVAVCLLGAIGEGAFTPDFGNFANFGNFGGFSNFPPVSYMPAFPQLPLYNFPYLPRPPRLPQPVFNGLNFNFPSLNFPTEDDVRNTVPKQGSYNGMFVSSASNIDGGETKILLNNNGEIFEKTIPHNEKSASPETESTSDVLSGFEFPEFPKFDKNFIKSHAPGNSESFQGSMVSSQSSYSNINGVEKSDGVITTLVNDNGKVNENVYKFGQTP